jgi:hypothetical protein
MIDDGLHKLAWESGALRGVCELQFEASRDFVTAYGFEFDNLYATLLAEPDFDTIGLRFAKLERDSESSLVDVSHQHPWIGALGQEIRWAWQLINHQGYSDGVRLEFGSPDSSIEVVVELIVIASHFRLFVPAPSKPAA